MNTFCFANYITIYICNFIHICEDVGKYGIWHTLHMNTKHCLIYSIFTESAHLAGSVYNSQCPSVCNQSKSGNPCFSVDLRLLVAERIANIGLPLNILVFCRFNDFWVLNFSGFWVFANQPTVHSWGRVCGCGCWRYWQVTRNMGHVTHITHDTWHDIWYMIFFN